MTKLHVVLVREGSIKLGGCEQLAESVLVSFQYICQFLKSLTKMKFTVKEHIHEVRLCC